MEDELIYAIIHDLKEPLRTVKAYSQLLYNMYENKQHKFTVEEQKQYEKYHAFIENANENMRTLINDFLRFYKVGEVDVTKESIKLAEIVTEIKQDLAIKLKETNARIRVQKDCNLFISRYYISRILYNLISNSLKFKKDDKKPYIKIICDITQNNYVFYVKDNGIGIPEDKKEFVFKPFKRLYSRSKYRGSGIGLAMVKKMTEHLNGSIEIESVKNKGTTFIITIPRYS